MSAPQLDQIGSQTGRSSRAGHALLENASTDPRIHGEEILRSSLRVLWRKRRTVVHAVVACLAVAALYLAISRKQYTAESFVRVNFGTGSATSPSRIAMDAGAMIDGETRIIKSRAVADRVVARWELDRMPAFAGKPSVLSWVIGAFTASTADDDAATISGMGQTASSTPRSDAFTRAAETVMANTTVETSNKSYMVGIKFRWPSAETATLLASGIAEEYLRERQYQSLAANKGRLSSELAQQAERLGDRHPLLVSTKARLLEIDGEIEKTNNQTSALRSVTLDSFTADIAMPAQKPLGASSPKPSVVLGLAALAGLMGAAAVILFLERYNSGLTNERDASDKIGLRCFGMVPTARPGDPPHIRAIMYEAVRSIGVAAALDVRSTNCTVVLITSSAPDEGKSLFTSTLASIITQSGRRVVLLDAIPSPLATTRQGEKWTADVENGGQLYRTVYLCNENATVSMEEVEHHLALARKHHDVVLIKAPPVLMLSDAARLARLSDTVMLLAHWRKTPSSMVASAVRRLRDAGIDVSGLVLTNVDLYQQGGEQTWDPAFYFAKYHRFYSSIAAPSPGSSSRVGP